MRWWTAIRMLGLKNPLVFFGLALIFAISQVSFVLVLAFQEEVIGNLSRSAGLVPSNSVKFDASVSLDEARTIANEISDKARKIIVVPAIEKEFICKIWWERRSMVLNREIRKWLPSVERSVTLQWLWIEPEPIKLVAISKDRRFKKPFTVSEFRPYIVSPFDYVDPDEKFWYLRSATSELEAGPYFYNHQENSLELFDEDGSARIGPLRILEELFEKRLPYESGYAFEAALFSRTRNKVSVEKLIQRSRLHYILFGAINPNDKPPAYLSDNLFSDIFSDDFDFSNIRLNGSESGQLEFNVAGHFRFLPSSNISSDLAILRLNDFPNIHKDGVNLFLVKAPQTSLSKITSQLSAALKTEVKLISREAIVVPALKRIKKARLVFWCIECILAVILFSVLTSLLQRLNEITRTERFLIRLYGGKPFQLMAMLVMVLVSISIILSFFLTFGLLHQYNKILSVYFYPLATFPVSVFIWASILVFLILMLSNIFVSKGLNIDEIRGR